MQVDYELCFDTVKKKKKIPSEPTCTQFNMYLLSTCYGICTIHHGGYRETED